MSLVDIQVLMQRTATITAMDETALGKMYELMRDEYNKNNVHAHNFDLKKFREQWSTFSAQHVGETNLNHQRIKNEGNITSLIDQKLNQ
jgi:hypothetical protein